MYKKMIVLATCSAILGCSSTHEAKTEVAKINSTDIVEFSATGERMVSQIKKSNGQYIFEFNLPFKQLPTIYSNNDTGNLEKVSYSCQGVTKANSVCQIFSNGLSYTLINKRNKHKEAITIFPDQSSD